MKNFINHIAPKVPFHTRPKPPLPPRPTASQSAPPLSQEPVLGGYAFAKITPAGEVSLSDPWGDIEKPFEASLGTPEFDPGFKGNLGEIAIMKYRNTKLRCQLSVGGAGGEITTSFQRIIKSEHAMRKFAHDCKELCRKYGFDGIDVDYEHPENSAEGRGLLELLRHTRATLDQLGHELGRQERYILSVATSMGEWSATHLPLREMNEVLDSGIDDSLLSLTGVPLHKLILGVPMYSRSFITKTGICGHHYDRVCGASEEATSEGTHMYNTLPRPNATEYHDSNLGVAYSFDGREWCSYDSPTSMSWKTQFVRERGLGGVFFWELAGGHVAAKPPHPRDLVPVAWEGLHGAVGGRYTAPAGFPQQEAHPPAVLAQLTKVLYHFYLVQITSTLTPLFWKLKRHEYVHEEVIGRLHKGCKSVVDGQGIYTTQLHNKKESEKEKVRKRQARNVVIWGNHV
ncbi:hypothetical protein H4Q26_011994 [Puccinia striiformis f. sp. tritici PST-130]|nr:hypothetical protein H4Q26_011994 [Puccinia striiformis f. sp. tritici PST-130]